MCTAIFDAVGFTAVFKNVCILPAIDGRTALSSGNTDMFYTATGRAFRAVFAFDDGITHSIITLVAATGTAAVAANQAIISAINLAGLANDCPCFTSACIDIIYIACSAFAGKLTGCSRFIIEIAVVTFHECAYAIMTFAVCMWNPANRIAISAMIHIRFQIIANTAATIVAIRTFACIGLAVAFLEWRTGYTAALNRIILVDFNTCIAHAVIAFVTFLNLAQTDVAFDRNRIGNIGAILFVVTANVRLIFFTDFAIRSPHHMIPQTAVTHTAFATDAASIAPALDQIGTIVHFASLGTTEYQASHRVDAHTVARERRIIRAMFTAHFLLNVFLGIAILLRHQNRAIAAIIPAALISGSACTIHLFKGLHTAFYSAVLSTNAIRHALRSRNASCTIKAIDIIRAAMFRRIAFTFALERMGILGTRFPASTAKMQFGIVSIA